MTRMSARLGLLGALAATVMWLFMAAVIAAFPSVEGAPSLTGWDMALGTLIGALLFGGVGAILGHLDDTSPKRPT